MSVEPSDKIQEEDESANSLSRPSTVDNGEHINIVERESIEKGKVVNGDLENMTDEKDGDGESNNLNIDVKSDRVGNLEHSIKPNDCILQDSSDNVNQFSDPINIVVSVSNEKVEPSEDKGLKRDSDEDGETSARHGTKRR